jgi:hypothetical protein
VGYWPCSSKKWLLACGWKIEWLRIYNYDKADEEYEGDWWNGYRLLILSIYYYCEVTVLFIYYYYLAGISIYWLCGGATNINTKYNSSQAWSGDQCFLSISMMELFVLIYQLMSSYPI